MAGRRCVPVSVISAFDSFQCVIALLTRNFNLEIRETARESGSRQGLICALVNVQLVGAAAAASFFSGNTSPAVVEC